MRWPASTEACSRCTSAVHLSDSAHAASALRVAARAACCAFAALSSCWRASSLSLLLRAVAASACRVSACTHQKTIAHCTVHLCVCVQNAGSACSIAGHAVKFKLKLWNCHPRSVQLQKHNHRFRVQTGGSACSVAGHAIKLKLLKTSLSMQLQKRAPQSAVPLPLCASVDRETWRLLQSGEGSQSLHTVCGLLEAV